YLHNDAIEYMHSLSLASRMVWSRAAGSELRELIRKHRPCVAHFHNTFPLMSPAAYYAVRSEKIPVIQTLHNFRLLCPNALFFRNGRVGEDCLGRSLPWPGIVHKCYRGSGAASAATAAMLATHRALGTWRTAVDVYIALSGFSRDKLITGGVPDHRIVVKPNFVFPDPGPGKGTGDYALFVGRLSAEKGVETLLQAWEGLTGRVTLKIVGDGPMKELVQEAASRDSRIQWLGSQPSESVYALMGEALFLVLPSRCYENFPRVVVEAFAKGTPVLASKLGAMAEIIDDGRTGLHFEPGDPIDLVAKIGQLLADPAALPQMPQAAPQ